MPCRLPTTRLDWSIPLDALLRRLTPTKTLTARLLELSCFRELNSASAERERVLTYNELVRRGKLPSWAYWSR